LPIRNAYRNVHGTLPAYTVSIESVQERKMMGAKPLSSKSQSIGDAAIDGLFGGLIAGVLMILILILAGILAGDTAAGILSRFSTGQEANPLTGGLVHLAVSGIYGVVFSLLIYGLPVQILGRFPGFLVGLAYGIILASLAVNILLPGLKSPLRELPLGILLLGHAVYGAILGWRVYPEIFTDRR
jgi:hypothetical protein